MVFYTDKFVPKRAAGCARGPFIFIRPEYKSDIGLLEHERVHAKQWYRTVGLHSFLYLFSKQYRLKSEVEAYREQLKYSPREADLYALFISTEYNINIDKDEAKKLLLD